MSSDGQMSTGAVPTEPGRCGCGHLGPLHVISESTGERKACSGSTCPCKRYVAGAQAVNRG